MRADRYKHTQFAWTTLSILVGLAAILFIGMLVAGFGLMPVYVIAFVALIGVLFGSLTVMVDEHLITCRFGPGPIRKRFLVADVVSAEPARNAWWWGWGIRLTPRGWLFNVSGLDAVELTMITGKHYRIGTNDPKGLARAIDRVIERRA